MLTNNDSECAECAGPPTQPAFPGPVESGPAPGRVEIRLGVRSLTVCKLRSPWLPKRPGAHHRPGAMLLQLQENHKDQPQDQGEKPSTDAHLGLRPGTAKGRPRAPAFPGPVESGPAPGRVGIRLGVRSLTASKLKSPWLPKRPGAPHRPGAVLPHIQECRVGTVHHPSEKFCPGTGWKACATAVSGSSRRGAPGSGRGSRSARSPWVPANLSTRNGGAKGPCGRPAYRWTP